MAVPDSTCIHNSSPRSHGVLQIKTAGCKLKIAAGVCAADSRAEGKICWGETLIITITFLPWVSRSAEDLTDAALASCQLSYTTKSRVLVRGNLPDEFTLGKISKSAGVEDRVWKVRVKSFQRQFILHEFMYPQSKATTQNPLCFEVWSACAKKTCVPGRFRRNS